MPIIDDKNKPVERTKKSPLTSRKIEDYQPGASQAHVLKALKKVAKSPKPSQKHTEPPVSTSKGT